jgi:hypothetical protein
MLNSRAVSVAYRFQQLLLATIYQNGACRFYEHILPVRLIKHEAIPACGPSEVGFGDGRPSRYFYWDDLPGRGRDPTR